MKTSLFPVLTVSVPCVECGTEQAVTVEVTPGERQTRDYPGTLDRYDVIECPAECPECGIAFDTAGTYRYAIHRVQEGV